MATFHQMLQYIKTCCDTVLASDSLFGLGRNEHFLILLNYDTKEPVQWRLQKLFDLLSQFQVGEHQNFPLICSAGVRFVSTEDTDIENAITQAAMSMESALKIRNHEIIFFDQSIYDPEILRSKIEENMERDRRNDYLLIEMGWIPIHFWEKEVNKQLDICVNKVLEVINTRKEM